MRLSIALGAVAAAGVSAFRDTSPFILASVAGLALPESHDQLQSSTRVLELAEKLLSGCPTAKYILVSQPEVHAADYLAGDSASKYLRKHLEADWIRYKVTISEVYGPIHMNDIKEVIERECEAPEVIEVRLPMIRQSARQDSVSNNDDSFHKTMEMHGRDSFTLIYISSSVEPAYQPIFQDTTRQELKRQVQPVPSIREDAPKPDANAPLFERYQFFSEGIFMGLLVTFFLLTILGVGVKALGSLEVPYGAFEKEMGPSAQKKQH